METIRQLKALWAYASWCAQAPASVPACDSFWNWVAVAAVTACALIGLYIIRKMARNFLAVRAERKRLAEASRVADRETMSQYRVEDEKLHPDPPQQEDIERRIRQALDERKLERR
jgi:flagellar biosynthesis/type III secretory pathway M-ring protein FliF/YscJ